MRRIFMRKNSGHEEAMCMSLKFKNFREKRKEKKQKAGVGFSESTLGFQPGIREVSK